MSRARFSWEIMEISEENKSLVEEAKEPQRRCSERNQKISIWVGIVLLFLGSMLVVKYGFVAQIGTFLQFVKEMGWWGNVMICFCFLLISFPLILGAYIPLTLGAGAIYGVLIVLSIFGS